MKKYQKGILHPVGFWAEAAASYSYNLTGSIFLQTNDFLGSPPGTFDSRGGIEVRYNGTIYHYEYTLTGGQISTQLNSTTDWAVPNDLNDHKAYDFKLDVTSGTPTSLYSDSTGVWLNVDTGGTITGSGLRWVARRTASGTTNWSWTLSMRDGSDTFVDSGVFGGSINNGA